MNDLTNELNIARIYEQQMLLNGRFKIRDK